jgi:arabinofuranan 3-O-arabinosyltransferase
MRRFLLQSRVRRVICWLVLLGWTGFVGVGSWRAFNVEERADGNRGHATIDFGGQWLVGRMIVEGQGRHLYERNRIRTVAQHVFRVAGGGWRVEGKDDSSPSTLHPPPFTQTSDAESLMDWLAGSDDPKAPEVIATLLSPLAANDALSESVTLVSGDTIWTENWLEHARAPRIGGALYPPIHALGYAPLALLRPPIAYRVMQGLILALAYFAGWVAERMTDSRVWWPVASLLVLMFPGFAGGLTLGQNGMFILTLALVGWWQLMCGREVLAGLCWGLLAFKPVWAAAFFLVPILTARWRMAASMALAGIVQILVTLPVVGWESWWNWLKVGQEAAQEYKRQENWIILSRDLLGIPRRWLLTFEDGLAKDVVWTAAYPATSETGAAEDRWDHPSLAVFSWGLWMAVLVVTFVVVWRSRQRRKELTGPFAAFVLSAAVLSCYHFMYYDFVAAALPMLLLFTEPRRYLRLQFRTLVSPLLLLLMLVLPFLGYLWDPSYHFPPWETIVLLALWAWCGYLLLNPSRSGDSHIDSTQFAELGANVGSTHKCLAD